MFIVMFCCIACSDQIAYPPPPVAVRGAVARPAAAAKATLKRKRLVEKVVEQDGPQFLSAAAERFAEEYTNTVEHGLLGGDGAVAAAPAWFGPALAAALAPLTQRLDGIDARLGAERAMRRNRAAVVRPGDDVALAALARPLYPVLIDSGEWVVGFCFLLPHFPSPDSGTPCVCMEQVVPSWGLTPTSLQQWHMPAVCRVPRLAPYWATLGCPSQEA